MHSGSIFRTEFYAQKKVKNIQLSLCLITTTTTMEASGQPHFPAVLSQTGRAAETVWRGENLLFLYAARRSPSERVSYRGFKCQLVLRSHQGGKGFQLQAISEVYDTAHFNGDALPFLK
jgi:hypothetical protein